MLLFTAQISFADNELLACRELQDVSIRLACYDRWVDKSFPPSIQQNTTQQETNQPTVKTPIVSASPTPRDYQPTLQRTAPEEEFGKPVVVVNEREEITARVTQLDKSAHNKIRVTLDNDQIWLQLDSSRMRLKAGDVVDIRASSLKSFQLRKQSGGKSIRVKRIK